MRTRKNIKYLFGHVATPDEDYQWYDLISPARSRGEPPVQLLPQHLRLDDQFLSVLIDRGEEADGLPRWVVSWGPVAMPWRDRCRGRVIRTRIVAGCESPKVASHLFACALTTWWPNRFEKPEEDTSLLEVSPAQQVVAVTDWTLNHVQRALEHRFDAHAAFAGESLREPLFRRATVDSIASLLTELNAAIESDSLPWRNRDPIEGTPVAVVSQGLLPKLHATTWRALGAEKQYPEDWTTHGGLLIQFPLSEPIPLQPAVKPPSTWETYRRLLVRLAKAATNCCGRLAMGTVRVLKSFTMTVRRSAIWFTNLRISKPNGDRT